MYHVKLYKVVARSFDKAVRRHTTVVYILSKYFRKSIMHKLKKNFTRLIMIGTFIFDTERCARKQIQLNLLHHILPWLLIKIKRKHKFN